MNQLLPDKGIALVQDCFIMIAFSNYELPGLGLPFVDFSK